MARVLQTKSHLTFQVDRDVAETLARLAEQNERSVGAEIRLAVRKHIEAMQPNGSEASKEDARP